MTFIHPPTPLSLAIGCGITLFDLWLCQRRAVSAMLEDLARLRLGPRRVLDCLEDANLLEVRRDRFGDVITMTWRADASTVMMAASRLILQWSTAGSRPLPNKRLKLAGLSRLEESERLCPGGHRLSSTTLAPTDLPPAA